MFRHSGSVSGTRSWVHLACLSPVILPAGSELTELPWFLWWSRWRCRCVATPLHRMRQDKKEKKVIRREKEAGNISPYCTSRLLTAVFKREEWVVCWEWLRCRDVQSSCSDLSSGQSLVKILLVHHSSPKTFNYPYRHSYFVFSRANIKRGDKTGARNIKSCSKACVTILSRSSWFWFCIKTARGKYVSNFESGFIVSLSSKDCWIGKSFY